VPDDPGQPADRLAPDDRLAAAVAELYGAAPEEFTGRRGELAAAARDGGDRAAARAIGALRRPTRAAWVVNRLARADPDAPPRLAEMAAALRAAQQAGQGRRLRELSAERDALIDGLTSQALAAAEVTDSPASLRLEVTQTLTAAMADPEVATDFAAGTLTRAVQWSGFGVLPADAGPGTDADSGSDTGADGDGDAGSAVAGTSTGRTKTAGTTQANRAGPTRVKTAGTNRAEEAGTARAKTAPAARGGKAGTARAEAAAARRQAAEAGRQAAEADRLERAAADRAARRREQQEEAERGLASASAAAAEAVGTEDRLEAEVRDLEERLGQARSELTAARLRARRAEVAERRARHALDQLGDTR
jgi:hypothetical protein